jgi:hypothetical protein
VIPIKTTKIKKTIPKLKDVSLKNIVSSIGVNIPKVGIPTIFLAKHNIRAPKGIRIMKENMA